MKFGATPLGYSKSRCVISLQVPLLSFICSIFCVFLSFSSSLTFLFVVCSYEAPKAQKQIQGPCGGCHEVRKDHK